MKTKLSAFLIAITLIWQANAQITVQNTQTPASLVQNVLLGFGVTASNIMVNGSPANANIVQGNVTYFDAAGTTFPIPNGVLLTTGNGVGAIGPNNSPSYTDNIPPTAIVSTDPHLNAIANANPTNGVVVEFDFVPSGDTISFNYLFASDEYPEFSPSTFNDAFGFFLWGPGISGPYTLAGYPAGGENLAIIPGTTLPVTINNLGPGAGQYPQYYTDNQNGVAYGSAVQYDGSTVLLSANASVQCNQTYHIKLAICNVGDQAYDSGVFLQANSFSSEAVQVAVATVSGDTTVIEGCTDANLMFIRPQSQINDTLIVNYTVTGSATMGPDYDSLQNPVTFLPGEDTIVLTINPIADGIPDNLEYITITATTITVCGDTIVSTGTIWIIDSVPLPIDEPDPTVYCYNDSVMVTVTASGGAQPYTWSWSNGQTGDTAYLATVSGTMQGSVDYYVTVTDDCGYTNTDTVTVTLNQTLMVDSTLMGPASACLPDGWASAYVSGVTSTSGQPYYNWTGPNANPGPYDVDATVITGIPSGWYYFTVIDDVCIAWDSVYVEQLDPPVAAAVGTPLVGCSPLAVQFTNNSQNATNFTWNFGNGNVVTVGNMNPQSQTYTDDALIMLIAADANNCADTTYLNVVVEQCGCTDPAAVNYDPMAVIDDESCVYPIPEVEAPNIFTPNGDGDNDYFELDTKFADVVDLTITNRWGNIMYQSSGPNPVWDGIAQNGNDAEEGTYFYTYKATGTGGDVTEGHGFFHLFRK